MIYAYDNIRGDLILKKNTGTFSDEKIVTDPNGSYTGRPNDSTEKPVQDADDL